MIFFSSIFLSLVGISIMFVQEDQLLLDPMSITHDPNVREFCWSLVDKNVEQIDKNITIESGLQPKIRKDGKKCCITVNENKNLTIPLQVLKKANSTKLYILINFTKFLRAPAKVIFVQLIPVGIILIFDVEMTSPENENYICECLVQYQNNSKKIFDVFYLHRQNNIEVIKMEPDAPFKIYYTCYNGRTSSLFSLITGKTNKKENSAKLELQIKLPFRRFIMVSWNRFKAEARVYNIAIYSMEDNEYCLKIFRIFSIMKFNRTKEGNISKRCGKDTPVEDLGLLVNGTEIVDVILDMIVPLNIYKTYKLSIFWTVDSGGIEENHRYFRPLVNENSGKFKWYNKRYLPDQDNTFQNIFQNVSVSSENPISWMALRDKKPILNTSNCLLFQEPIFVAKYLERIVYNYDFNESVLTSKFHPYAYIPYKEKLTIEIFQIKMNKNNKSNVRNAKLSPNDAEYKFVVSWEIQNSTTTISPAIYEISMINTNNSACVAVYFLVCRTCHKIYVDNSRKFLGSTNCTSFWKENYFEAMDNYIQFTTEMMSHSTNYRARIRGIKENIFTSIQETEEKEIKESWWSQNKGIVIGIVSSLSIALIILGFIKRSKKNAPTEEQSNVYSGQEEHETQS